MMGRIDFAIRSIASLVETNYVSAMIYREYYPETGMSTIYFYGIKLVFPIALALALDVITA